jgi:hypothetical protein
MKYFLFISLFSILFYSGAQQNVPATSQEEKEKNSAPAMNSNYAEPIILQESTKKDESKKKTMSAEGQSSSESQLIQQRYLNANTSFQQSYSSSKKMSSRKSTTKEEQLDMNMRLETMRATNASGFEYQLAEYQIGNHDVSKIDLIYSGAQKNLGPAGATLYIIKDEILGKSSIAPIPSYLDFAVHQSKESMFNTPPVFSIYVSMLNLRHLLKNGGVAAQQELNERKAALLYAEIDNNDKFTSPVSKEDRSNMNVIFFLKDEETHKDRFDQLWNDAGIVGLKGYRTLGGYRASMYNALPLASVEVLVQCMKAL